MDMSGYNHPVRRKRYSENLTEKIYLRLGFLFRKSTIYAGQISPPYLAVTTDNWKIRRQCPTWPTYFVHTGIILFPQVLIFSQFTLMLDILEDYLYMRNIRHCRLDGRCKVEDRQLAVSAQQVFTRLL